MSRSFATGDVFNLGNVSNLTRYTMASSAAFDTATGAVVIPSRHGLTVLTDRFHSYAVAELPAVHAASGGVSILEV